MMTAVQAQAFEDGTGSIFTAGDALLTAQLFGVTAIFIWTAWLCVSAYAEWGDGGITQGQMIAVWCRSVLVLMILLYLFTI